MSHENIIFQSVLKVGQSEWDFFSQADPTNGLVDYQTQADATQKNLAFVDDDGTVVFAVDDTTTLSPGSNRDSCVAC